MERATPIKINAPPRYEMIEVKGPGDRLQDNQKRWIDFCARHAMRWAPEGDA